MKANPALKKVKKTATIKTTTVLLEALNALEKAKKNMMFDADSKVETEAANKKSKKSDFTLFILRNNQIIKTMSAIMIFLYCEAILAKLHTKDLGALNLSETKNNQINAARKEIKNRFIAPAVL